MGTLKLVSTRTLATMPATTSFRTHCCKADREHSWNDITPKRSIRASVIVNGRASESAKALCIAHVYFIGLKSGALEQKSLVLYPFSWSSATYCRKLQIIITTTTTTTTAYYDYTTDGNTSTSTRSLEHQHYQQ